MTELVTKENLFYILITLLSRSYALLMLIDKIIGYGIYIYIYICLYVSACVCVCVCVNKLFVLSTLVPPSEGPNEAS